MNSDVIDVVHPELLFKSGLAGALAVDPACQLGIVLLGEMMDCDQN